MCIYSIQSLTLEAGKGIRRLQLKRTLGVRLDIMTDLRCRIVSLKDIELWEETIKEKVHDIAKLALEEGARITLESVNF